MFVQIPKTNLVRDTRSMGLSVQNTTEKNEYYAKRRMLAIQREEINILKAEISELKALVLQLLNKDSNV